MTAAPERKLVVSRLRGRTVQAHASRDSTSLGRFRFWSCFFCLEHFHASSLLLRKSQPSVIPITVGRNITCNHHIGLVSLAAPRRRKHNGSRHPSRTKN